MSPEGREAWSTSVTEQLRESAALKLQLADSAGRIEEIAEVWLAALRRGGRIFFCGNGGSAADSQHLAAELSGRYKRDRPPLAGASLTSDAAVLTCVSNDFGYEEVFARQILALGREGDVLVALSTSGESPNVIKAVEAAGRVGMVSVAFTGSRGRLGELADFVLSIPSDNTARIQEAYLAVGHIICDLVDSEFG